MSDRPCIRPQIKQQSSGQAGPEINRDLEILFKIVNAHSRCLIKISEYLDNLSRNGGNGGGGAFDGGGGSDGSPPPPPPFDDDNTLQAQNNFQHQFPYFERYSLSANWSVPEGFCGNLFITPSTNIDVTLYSVSMLGQWVRIFNCATGVGKTITVKDPGGGTICTLLTGYYSDVIFVKDLNGTLGWSSSVAALT